ncbi:MAG TPA: YjzD family protein [Candidatus Ligilactobacillus excrementavium]|nr:YjzD family protein [Candidatus Ligilactobacillus excrementavium]
MLKQLTLLFWSAIYGLVLGYIVSALTGGAFDIATSAVVAMIGGFIAINLVAPMVKTPKTQTK